MNLSSPWSVMVNTLGLRHDYAPVDEPEDMEKYARVIKAQKASAKQRSAAMEMKILAAIKAADHPLTAMELANAIGQKKPNGSLFRHLKVLSEAGVISVIKTVNKYKSSTHLYGRI